MSKQTAVEWLIEQYVDSAGILNPIDIQNALQMEREQIVEAFQTEWSQHNYSGEQYYANTYGKEASHEA